MKPLICKQCGGQIDPETYICYSCGTAYERPPIHVHELVCEDPRFVTVSAGVALDEYRLGGDFGEKMIEHSLHEIACKLGEAMIPLAEFRTNVFPESRQRQIVASIRVKKPESERHTLRYNDPFHDKRR